jgi:hypothetical protein
MREYVETEAARCIRPDGKPCGHAEKRHLKERHPFMTDRSWGCVECWRESGSEIVGPYIHDYSPHVLTEAGWLPV